MGLFMDYAKKALNSTNEKINKAKEEAARMDTGTLVRRWRNCSDPLKRAAYYQEMQSRDDVRDYL